MTESTSPCIRYGAFDNAEGRIVLVREPGDDGHRLAIFTADHDSAIEAIVARCAHRWPIETAFAAGEQLLGIGLAPTGSSARSNAPCPSNSSFTASSSSDTPCTATTRTASTPAAAQSLGTATSTSPPSKTCSPSLDLSCNSAFAGVVDAKGALPQG